MGEAGGAEGALHGAPHGVLTADGAADRELWVKGTKLEALDGPGTWYEATVLDERGHGESLTLTLTLTLTTARRSGSAQVFWRRHAPESDCSTRVTPSSRRVCPASRAVATW